MSRAMLRNITLSCLFCTPGIAMASKFKVNQLVPSRASVALHSVAVRTVNGPAADDIRNGVARVLNSDRRGDYKSGYRTVSDNITSSAMNVLSADEAAALLDFASEYSTGEVSFSNDSYEKKAGDRTVTVTKWCANRLTTMSVELNVSSRDGQVLYNQDSKDSFNDMLCNEGSDAEAATRKQVREGKMGVVAPSRVEPLLTKLAVSMVSSLLPYWDSRSLDLIREMGKDKEAKKVLNDILGRADDDPAAAVKLWMSYPQSGAAMHNIGVYYEMNGYFDKAIQMYDQAMGLVKPIQQKSISEAKSRAQQRAKEWEHLQTFYNLHPAPASIEEVN